MKKTVRSWKETQGKGEKRLGEHGGRGLGRYSSFMDSAASLVYDGYRREKQ